jgi:hypothetical protein
VEFEETDYILGVWFAADKKGNNFYQWVKRDKDGLWHIQVTFRYNKSHDAWDDKDEKRRQNYTSIEPNEEKMILHINGIFDVIKKQYTAFNDILMVQGNTAKFMGLMNTKDWLHTKMVH